MSNGDQTLFRPLSQLRLWEDNYNHNDVSRIATSIRRFGFNTAPRLWQGDVVMAGNHSVMALRLIQESGEAPPQNVIVAGDDWLVQVIDVTHLSELEATAYAIADNQLARQAVTDDERLAHYLQEISERDAFLIEAVGYDEATFNQMMAYLSTDMLPEEFPEYDEAVASSVKTCTCPNCGHEFAP